MTTYEERFQNELGLLAPRHRCVFAASCCERLIPNYRAFAMMEGWHDPDILIRVMDEIWQFLREGNLGEERVQELIQTVEAHMPDIDDEFDSMFDSLALRAALAVSRTLECCLNGDVRIVADVGELAVESMEIYLELVNQPYVTGVDLSPDRSLTGTHSFDLWVQQEAPLMLAELKQQRDDLTMLRTTERLTVEALTKIRQLSSRLGIQPFARGLVKQA